MISRQRAVLALACLLAMATSATAETIDFTFMVPIDIKDSEADSVGVQCAVFPTSSFCFECHGKYVASASYWNYLSGGGTFKGTVMVQLNAIPPKLPSEGKYYSCRLLVRKDGEIRSPSTTAYGWARANQGAGLKVEASGPLR